MRPSEAPAGTVGQFRRGSSQWAPVFDAKVIEWNKGMVRFQTGGFLSVDETRAIELVRVYNNEVKKQPVVLLSEAVLRLNEIRNLAIDGSSIDGSHHKQFYITQILKLVDVESWKSLDDKGIPP